jgi:potassium-transporting ATPase ATP-binding subunit
MDFLCANRPLSSHAQYKTCGVRGMLTLVLRGLHPGQANRRPAVFILEVSAALLSVLALRDKILGGSAMSFEALFAVGLWGTLLAVACGLAIREA